MRLAVLQEQFIAALSTVARAIDSRPTIPILANILIRAVGDDLILVASNHEMTITARIGAQLEQEGALTVPAKQIVELVANTGAARIDLESTDNARLKLVAGKSRHTLVGIDAGEYPPVGQFAIKGSATISAAALGQIVREVGYATGSAVSTPILGAIHLRVNPPLITAQALDSYRAAVTSVPASSDFAGEYIVPISTMREAALLFKDGDVQVQVGTIGAAAATLFRFKTDHVELISQLVSGKAPDVTTIIPDKTAMTARVERKALEMALRRARVFVRDGDFATRLVFDPEQGIGVFGKSQERGESDNWVDAAVEGEGFSVWLKLTYLTDAVSAFVDDEVLLSGTNKAPHVLMHAEGTPLVSLITRMGDDDENAERDKQRAEAGE